MSDKNIMQEDKQFISKIYKKYLIPSTLGILAGALAPLANSLIAGNRFPGNGMAVIAFVSPIYFIYVTLGSLIGTGGSALTANYIGKCEYKKSHEVFTLTYILIVIAATILTITGIVFLDGIIGFLGVPEPFKHSVGDYARVVMLGGIFTMGIYLPFNFLRLDGKGTVSIYIFFILPVIAITLSLILSQFYGIWSLALSASAGFGLTTIIGSIILFTKSNNFKLVKLPDLKQSISIIFDILKTGSPMAVENVSNVLRAILLNRLIVTALGTEGMSYMNIAYSIIDFSVIFIAGVSGTIIPFIGVFSKEKDINGMRLMSRTSIKYGLWIVSVFTVICIVFSRYIIIAFGVAPTRESVTMLIILSVSFIPAVLNNILVAFHVANSKIAAANIMTALRVVIFVVLFSWLLIGKIGFIAVGTGFLIAEILTLLIVPFINIIYSHNKPYLSKLFLIDLRAEKTGTYISYSINNDVDEIIKVSLSATDFCEQNAQSPKKIMLVSLALEEMLLSIKDNCLGDDKSQIISIRIVSVDNLITIRIRHFGSIFNPISYYEKNCKQKKDNMDFDDSTGIKMIIKAAESVIYQRTFGINNLTVII